ncbi:hypothetical protein BaRGS_00016166 [Batillaria attramentaria]|uniref:Uncharacterized protein n=1 Tax=Batillaria attramentaria TaxID=370345 RepID=A0ABD0KZ74_9CAEN
MNGIDSVCRTRERHFLATKTACQSPLRLGRVASMICEVENSKLHPMGPAVCFITCSRSSLRHLVSQSENRDNPLIRLWGWQRINSVAIAS